MATIDDIRGKNVPQDGTPPPAAEAAANAGGQAAAGPAPVAYKAPSLADAAQRGSGSRDTGDDDGLGELERAYEDYKSKRQADLGSLNATLDQMAGKHRPLTDAELAKERKRRRRDAVFAAIGDGVSALSNLYFTTQYAPDAHRQGKSLSEGMKQRWDKLEKERDEGMRQYLDILAQKYRLGKEAGGEDLAWARVFADMKQRRQERKAQEDAAKAAAAQRQAEADRDYRLKEAGQESAARRNAARDAEAVRHNRAMERISKARATGGSGSKKRDLKDAYDYWDSLTDVQKSALRDANQRKNTPVKDRRGRTTGYTYDNDDEKWIEFVYEQHLANERNLEKGGYGVDGVSLPGKEEKPGYTGSPWGKKRIEGFGAPGTGGGNEKKTIKGFGGH